jgi:hypothetical protein
MGSPSRLSRLVWVTRAGARPLDTYSHLWPGSEERTRAAVELALGNFADYVRTDGTAATQNSRSEA